MISRSSNVVGVSLAFLLALAVGGPGRQQLVEATFDPLGGAASGVLGGLAGAANGIVGTATGLTGSAAGLVGSAANAVNTHLTGGLSPLAGGLRSSGAGGHGMLGQLGGASGSAASAAAASAAANEGGLIGSGLRAAQSVAGAVGTGVNEMGRLGEAAVNGVFSPLTSGILNPMAAGGAGANPMLRNSMRGSQAASAAAAAASAASAAGSPLANEFYPGAPQMMGPAGTPEYEAGAAAGAAAAASTAANVAAGPAAAAAASSAAAAGAQGAALVSAPAASRQAIAQEAMRNAQAEAALAGSEMVAHGANNARSAALASNAYRNAKLASARDRVNIAGTIQNTARISDASIATHDAATKAEDSLLGSELAVDSASTVLDSDGAYIPPVTSSLLRSLPYGRLGLRNIIPKPLTHPSPNLPDVWLNGFPVRYNNVPLRWFPPVMFGYGSLGYPYGPFSPYAPTTGGFNQPFTSNNGLLLNGMVFDPAFAFLTTNLNGLFGISDLPILAEGQLEAQDELAMANLLQMQQLNGVGMSTTYQGYGRLNPVPMITGSVTDANLMPTTTIGTTYPIGSALVIEPRDSFFQDYNDYASSRQNFDERQQ